VLVLQSDLVQPTGVAFSPDGTALLAATGDHVQVWPRLDAAPRAPANVTGSLERYAFTPNNKKVLLYLSGNSRVRALTVSTGRTAKTEIPEGGPSYFFTEPAGGFVLSSHRRGSFARFELDADAKSGFTRTWLIERTSKTGRSKKAVGVGSHYYFGGVSAVGTFVSLEYRFNGNGEPYEGLVVRAVEDGKLLFKHPLKPGPISEILDRGLKLAIHPSGAYLAIPHRAGVKFWPMTKKVALPAELENVDAPPDAKPKGRAKPPAAECNGLAFHPSGAVLAAACNDGTVKLYDTTTWEVARSFAWDVGPVRAVCFSPDGTRGAAVGTGRAAARGRAKEGAQLVVWDVDL